MTINNKYHLGDKVYFINTENRAQVDEVSSIHAYVYSDHVNVIYCLKDSNETVNENEAFATEAELKDYVFKDLIEFV